MQTFKNLSLLTFVLFSFLYCGQDYEKVFYQGQTARQDGKFEKAEKSLKKAIKIKPTAEAYKELGNVYYLGYNNLKKAEANYIKALEIDKDYVNAIHNMGMLSVKKYEKTINKKGEGKKKYLKQAKEWLNKALKIDPKFHLSYTEMGTVYYYQKEYKKGIKVLKKAIAEYPDNARSYLLLGEIYYLGLKNPKKAFESLEESHRISAQVPQTLLLLAEVCKKLKKKALARTYYLKYIALLRERKEDEEIIKRAEKDKKKYI